jgi:hypothetical protein
MEINKYRDITGVVTTEAIPEGRMVLVSDLCESHDFGSRTELRAVKLPDTSTEAAKARYCITWAVDNSQTPIYEPYPAFDFALRGGWDQAENVAFDAKVHLTYPGNKVGLTIPSGALALAFGPGEFTVESGAWVDSADARIPGNYLAVADTDTDDADSAGKLKYSATATFAEVVRYDSSDDSLTFRILY